METETRLVYVDDSGADQDGWTVFAWHEFDHSKWKDVLAHRLRWRKQLYRNEEFRIPASQDLHTADFVAVRKSLEVAANPNLNLENRRKKQVQASRLKVIEQALHNMRTSPHLQVGYVARRLSPDADAGAEKGSLYQQLIARLDEAARESGTRAIVIMDGIGDDGRYWRAHRQLELETRAVIEDPLFQRQQTSQLVQMADLIAYAAYQHEHRAPGKEFAWSWWENYLASKASPLTGIC